MQAQECCDGGSLRALIDKAAATWHPSGKRMYSYGDALRWCIQVWLAQSRAHVVRGQHVEAALSWLRWSHDCD